MLGGTKVKVGILNSYLFGPTPFIDLIAGKRLTIISSKADVSSIESLFLEYGSTIF